MTAEELLRLDLADKRTELIGGRLVVREPAGARQGGVALRLAVRLGSYVERTRAGRLYATDTGFKIASAPDTVRAPDLSFVRSDRLPLEDPETFLELAPDLVVEALGRGNRPGQVRKRVAQFLAAGSRLIWVIDPRTEIARVYRADGTESVVEREDSLDGEDVLPGFRCSLSELLSA